MKGVSGVQPNRPNLFQCNIFLETFPSLEEEEKEEVEEERKEEEEKREDENSPVSITSLRHFLHTRKKITGCCKTRMTFSAERN